MLIGPGIVKDRMTGDSYLHMSQNDLPEQLEDVSLDTRRHMYLQHDGAPIHSTKMVTQHLNNTYPNRWIGRGSIIRWPARSPNLIRLDFCLWGLLKGEVYRTKMKTRAEIVARVNNAYVRIKDCCILQKPLFGRISDIVRIRACGFTFVISKRGESTMNKIVQPLLGFSYETLLKRGYTSGG
jgi:hypothetical protein